MFTLTNYSEYWSYVAQMERAICYSEFSHFISKLQQCSILQLKHLLLHNAYWLCTQNCRDSMWNSTLASYSSVLSESVLNLTKPWCLWLKLSFFKPFNFKNPTVIPQNHPLGLQKYPHIPQSSRDHLSSLPSAETSMHIYFLQSVFIWFCNIFYITSVF